MDDEYIRISQEDAEALIKRIISLRENRRYRDAIDLLTKLIIFEEFSSSIFFCRICPSLYQELAELYELTNAPVSVINTLERYFSQYMKLDSETRELRKSLVQLYLQVAEREHHSIPKAIGRLINN